MSVPTAAPRYELMRFVFLRLLGLVYAVAFLILVEQGPALIGSRGVLPAASYLHEVGAAYGHAAWWKLPTLFWLDASDATLFGSAGLGLALAVALLLGLANVPLLAALWLLYMSFVHVGQIFYGYGWEILLLETGFLAIFAVPLWRPHPFPKAAMPVAVVWLLRWLVFRVMFGAGLIKLRGDPCWRDLSCMVFHYETQPIPNPSSYWLHQLPAWFHAIEVGFNHVAELAAPWMLLGPRRMRHVAGALLVLFQVLLIVSGNLSFLNWLTLAICLASFDDGLLARVLPPALVRRSASPVERAGAVRRVLTAGLCILVGLLSVDPIANMLSRRQVMNTSFDPLDLVNTYGAFGSISRERREIVLEGTDDATPDDSARWLEYEFRCKPGDVRRRPCVVSPYHHRIDWQMWFAAMSDAADEPWLARLVDKLLDGDPAARALLADGPFRDHPPRFIRGELYLYRFTRPGEDGGAWWHRTRIGEYFAPVARQALAR